MDLNQLYFDHQILVMRAASSPASANAAVDLCKAAQIAGQIRGIQRAEGADAQAYWNRPAANDQAPCSAVCAAGA